MVDVTQILRQLNRVLHGTARMGADQIRHQVLVHPAGAVHLIITPGKCGVNAVGRFPQHTQYALRYMLRRDLQLPGNVMLHQLPEEGVVLVQHHIIEADA